MNRLFGSLVDAQAVHDCVQLLGPKELLWNQCGSNPATSMPPIGMRFGMDFPRAEPARRSANWSRLVPDLHLWPRLQGRCQSHTYKILDRLC
jgi:hypothetical protein